MLRATGIVKRYGALTALAGVDLAVDPGEIVALVGENGSGKSTLAKVLAGAIAPDGGVVELDGVPCRFQRPREAIDRGIAMVAQELTAVPGLSIAENVLLTRLPRAHRHFSKRRLAAAAAPVLASVGVDCDPHAPFASLRSGDRELVEVAKALATGPRLLILDEATSRLGEQVVERLFTLLRRLAGDGLATILITHRLPEICELADRAVVLRDGVLVGELVRDEIDQERLSRLMVGRDLSDFFHKRAVAAGAPTLELDGLVAAGTDTPVSLTVRSGEVLGLAGLVGSGRTELLETVAGVRRSGGGRVLVEGKQVQHGAPREAIAAGIGLVPEDRHRQGLVVDAPIRENMAMGTWPALRRVRRRSERDSAGAAIERLRIKVQDVDLPARSLSGGNQQKVVLARCLDRGPKVLLLDEPTRGIDVGAKEEIFQLVGELLEQGVAILLVSSDLLEILGLSDRVAVLHERRLVGLLEREEATEERIAFLSAGGRDERDAA